MKLIVLPELSELSIRNNRSSEYSLIEATNDIEAISTWLTNYKDSIHTLNSYKKEVERFLMWLEERSLSDVTVNDLQRYKEFLRAPSEECVGDRCEKMLEDGIINPNWRPFAGPLSQTAANYSITVIGSLCSFLVHANYLSGNPVALSRYGSKERQETQHVDRYINTNEWEFLKNVIKAMPCETRRQIERHERTRWVISLLYYGALRRAEVSSAQMGDFFMTSNGYWRLAIEGKGFSLENKNQRNTIPVPTPLLEALIRFRQHLNLSDLPEYNDPFPLLPNVFNSEPLTSKAVYNLVKKTFELAYQQAEIDAPEFCNTFKKASTHWMRHTSATHQLDANVDIRIVQKNLRHANIKTTQIYSNIDKDNQHIKTEEGFTEF